MILQEPSKCLNWVRAVKHLYVLGKNKQQIASLPFFTFTKVPKAPYTTCTKHILTYYFYNKNAGLDHVTFRLLNYWATLLLCCVAADRFNDGTGKHQATFDGALDAIKF